MSEPRPHHPGDTPTGALVHVELDPTGRVRDIVLDRQTRSLPLTELATALLTGLQQAQDQARRNTTAADLLRAGAALGFSAALAANHDTGLDVIRHAVERSGHPDHLGLTYLHLAELLTGPLNSVDDGVLVARRGAERLAAGHPYRTRLLAIAGNGLFRAGQWSEADAVLRTATEHHPTGTEAAELLLSRCRLWVGFGDTRAAHRGLDTADRALKNTGTGALPLLTLRAGLAIWEGRHADARAAVQRGLDTAHTDDPVLLGVLAWHGLRAEAEAHVAGQPTDPAARRRLTAVVQQIRDGLDDQTTPVRAVLDGYLALCEAETNRAADHHDPEPWARAAQIWDREGHPYPAAYARLRHAEAALHRRTRTAAATAALRQAYAAATSMGARPFAHEIVGIARRFRVVLSDGTGPGGHLGVLTRREGEVLTLLAEGLTNRAIGRLLSISERTVGVHVGHIFDKLQVRTRVQAARALTEATRPQPGGVLSLLNG